MNIPSQVTCIDRPSSALNEIELPLRSSEPYQLHKQPENVNISLMSLTTGRASPAPQSADLSGVHGTVSELEAIDARIVDLVSSADKTYQDWQIYLGKTPGRTTEEIQSLSKSLKQFCIYVHELGLRCSELQGEQQTIDSDNTLLEYQQPHRLTKCFQTLSNLQQAIHVTNSDSPPEPLSPGLTDFFRTELVGHKTWIAAAQHASNFHGMAKLLCTDFDMPNHCDTPDAPRKEFSLPLRISPQQNTHKILKSFRFSSQETILRHALKHSELTALETLVQCSAYVRWASNPGSLLWITGPSRTELIVLAASTTQYLVEHASSICAVCYFFCETKHTPGETLLRLVKAIVGQLAQQSLRAYGILEDSEHEPFQRTFEGLCSIMGSMLDCFDQVSLVLEGLETLGPSLQQTGDMFLSILAKETKSSTSTSQSTVISCLIIGTEGDGLQEYIQALEGEGNLLDSDGDDETTPSSIDKKTVSGRLLDVSHMHWDKVSPRTLFLVPVTNFVPLGAVARIVESRNLEQFTRSTHEIDRTLTLFLTGNGDPSYRPFYMDLHRDNNQPELLHPMFSEFIAYIAGESMISLGASLKTVSSSSMAIFCLRYLCLPQFASLPEKEYRAEKRRVAHRDQLYPFYRFAAKAWMQLALDHWDDQELLKAVQQLFSPEHSGGFLQWVIQCARAWFPHNIGFKALSHKPLTHLTSILKEPYKLRLQVAASMGLNYVCASLLDEGVEINESSALGTPLYCAFAGPLTFIGPGSDVIQEHARMDKTKEFRPQQRATIKLLLDRGADCNRGSLSMGDIVSTTTLALNTCSRLLDADLFFKITGEDPKFDSQFRTFFDRGIFLDVMNRIHPAKKDAQRYLNDLCQGLAQRTISCFDKNDAAESIAVYESLWRYTLANSLDWFDKIEHACVPGVSDEAFDTFVEMEAIESVNALRLVSKDPRFNPNRICEDGAPLLLKARSEGVEIVKLFVEKGADLSLKDEQGLTIAHLSAQLGEDDILRYIVEQGADTAVLTDKSDDPKLAWLSGRNVWHFAASRGPETFSTLIEIGIKNVEELFAVSSAGRTPLVDMIFELSPLAEDSEDSINSFDTVMELLLKIPVCDPRLFQSKTPVLHKAVDLGSQDLIRTLLQMGAEVCLDSDGASPLHACRVEAGQPYLTYVRDLCSSLPLQDQNGKTPLESIISDRYKGSGGDLPSYVYEELFGAMTRESKDPKGRCLWERVCSDLVPRFAMTMGSRSQLIIPFVDYLINRGIMADYESGSETSGVKVLLDGLSEADTVPIWLGSVICQILQNTKHKQSLSNGRNVVTCMKWASRINHIELVKLMLEHGASVHEEAFKISVLQAACLSATCSMAIFNLLLEHANQAKLNELGQQGIGLVHMLLQKEVNQREPKLRALLAKGADSNLCSASGVPALIMFLMENYIDCVETLLEFGADVNAKNSDGMDIALSAASRGNVAVLEKLRNHEKLKVDWTSTCFTKFNVRRADGPLTAVEFLRANGLHLAALHGHASVIEFYITNKFLTDLECITLEERYRPLHFASLGGSIACIKLLKRQGADINTRTRDGSSALHIAVRANHRGAVEALIEMGLPVDSLDSLRITPLIYAIKQGSKEIADALLDAGAHVHETRQDPNSIHKKKIKQLLGAIDTAIRRADIRLCRLLWNAGCPLNLPLPSCRGCTPLMAAIGQGRTEIALWMLEVIDTTAKMSGMDGQCDKHFRHGTTALHIACGLQNCETLISKLLDVYQEIGSNWLQWPVGVLHVCAARNNTKALSLILKYAKDHEVQLQKKYPDLPHQHEKWLLNQTITASELDEPYYYGLAPLHLAIIKNSIETVKLLLQYGADPNQDDIYGSAPIHLAIKEERSEMVQELIKYSCQIDRQDGSGYTPLMRAVDHGLLDIVKTLVEAGADISICDSDRMSLLNIAGDSSQTPSIFQYLLQLGIDPYKPDNFGYYPLHDAILDTHFTSYVVNSDLDFSRACEHDVFKGLLSMALESRGILPMIIRRIPSQFLPDKLINVWPQRYVSPLCNAARRGNVEALEILIRHGADLEFEGSDDGTALMSACRAGHMQAIAYLVRAGAVVSYVKNGQMRSALLAGKRFEAVVTWLLVERWTEQKQLTSCCDDGFQDAERKPWAGTIVVEMELTGLGNRYGHAWRESMIDYLRRLNTLRLELRGEVVNTARWH